MSQYLLARHAYVCRTEDHDVLLDLKSNRYLGLTAEQSRALEHVVVGWPSAGCTIGDSADRYSLIREMTAQSLLTTVPDAGKPALPISVLRPASALIEGYSEVRVAVRTVDAASFVIASLIARFEVRWRPIRQIVERVRTRAERRGRPLRAGDIERARELVTIFGRCIPLLGGSESACLVNSLALVHFLAGYRIFPKCVFGVKTRPFGAHAWVQQDDMVFNDTPEHVRRYTPILAI